LVRSVLSTARRQALILHNSAEAVKQLKHREQESGLNLQELCLLAERGSLAKCRAMFKAMIAAIVWHDNECKTIMHPIGALNRINF
jgi:hypothetical protein